MNFDIIKEFSDENISKLYNDIVIDGIDDDLKIGCCECNGRTMWGCFISNPNFGYCSVMKENAANSGSCSTWCSRNNTKMTRFYIYCYCAKYSQHEGAYGDVNRCPY